MDESVVYTFAISAVMLLVTCVIVAVSGGTKEADSENL